MRREGDTIILSMNEAKDLVHVITVMYDDVPVNIRNTKYCCGFFSIPQLFIKTVEEKINEKK